MSLYIPAVHHHGAPLGRVVAEHTLAEGEESRGVRGHAVVRPHQEVELPDLSDGHLGLALTSKLQGRGGGRRKYTPQLPLLHTDIQSQRFSYY